MDDFWNPSPDTVERCDEDRPLDERHLWPQDTGKLPYDARCALLQLIKGPYIDESDPLWSAVLNNQQDLSSHLADMLLELYVDAETGIAFARNASTGERTVLKATRSNVMTLLDTIMVLTLRKELQMGGTNRVFIGAKRAFRAIGSVSTLGKSRSVELPKQAESIVEQARGSSHTVEERHRRPFRNISGPQVDIRNRRSGGSQRGIRAHAQTSAASRSEPRRAP